MNRRFTDTVSGRERSALTKTAAIVLLICLAVVVLEILSLADLI